MDISGVYLQGLGWSRIIYIRPPQENNSENTMWILEKPAYGLVDSGSIWYLTSDDALKNYGLHRDSREYTLYAKKSGNSISLIVLTQVENYIYTGVNEEMTRFE